MIFLAVTMGFFAESFREHLTAREKENEYISSLVGDLILDSANLQEVINENNTKLNKLDSLLTVANADLGMLTNRKKLYQYASSSISFYSRFTSIDATMLQLKNAGGFQFIRHEHAADSIALYDQQVRNVYAAEAPYAKAINDALDAMSQLIVFNRVKTASGLQDFPLLTNSPREIAVFFNRVSLVEGWTQNYINNLKAQQPATSGLIFYLKSKYSF